MIFRLLFLLPLLVSAQDMVRVASPNGQVEVHLGVSLPSAPGSFLRLSYQVNYRAKPLLETSYLGFWIKEQEPILGENIGLSESMKDSGEGYNSFFGQFLQNGSLGRRINIELRVYDEGVAFRYLIPRSSNLDDLLIDSEETEFHLAAGAISRFESFWKVEQPGLAWIGITEVPVAHYGKMSLVSTGPSTFKSDVAPFEGVSPFVGPWRVILIAQSSEELRQSKLAHRLP